MADQAERLRAFVELGKFFREYSEYCNSGVPIPSGNDWHLDFQEVIAVAGHKNGWFTEENILYSLEAWGALLTYEQLNRWLSNYDLKNNHPKTVALIMAGNIPLVGFHDFLSVLMSGNRALVKLSSNDAVLLPFIAQFLGDRSPSLKNEMEFASGKLGHFDAVIATGSDNTARYFEHYFGHKPHIIRKNRNSVAILTGKESHGQLKALGEDVFRYYGLGCRSVSKVFVPEGYDFSDFFKAIFDYNPIINQAKYANNYDYNKAVYLMSDFKMLENGFLVLKKDGGYHSPIATLFYEEYGSLGALKDRILEDAEKIQCVVADGLFENEVAFGETQKPGLKDYADGIDTVEFLLKTKAN
ncbi:acyl-CoA reductase [Maribacter polysaccharolyticus]|uniref:acyl-CoA reductase n=1 Tax=Maribacter polysaccharolyticus TaxID=3020831 RepID=UPI00237F454C|nr:acyl-CoA reductase [Maribacter polysaccharolyticus]MDE3740356.1 acyl-CoA reductase [Maribacter polysaccharolyticus]